MSATDTPEEWALWGVVQWSVRPWALCFPLQQLLQLLQLLPQLFRIWNPSERVGVSGRIWADPKPSQPRCHPKERCLSSSCCDSSCAVGAVGAQLGGKPHSAVSILLPATPISSNISLLTSHWYSIILQPSRQAEFAAMAIVTAGSLHTNSTFC